MMIKLDREIVQDLKRQALERKLKLTVYVNLLLTEAVTGIDLNGPPCPVCGETYETFYKCEDGTIACEACYVTGAKR